MKTAHKPYCPMERKCQYEFGCGTEARVFLLHPDSAKPKRWSSPLCIRHATNIASEYAEKLNQKWTQYPIYPNGCPVCGGKPV